MEFVLASCFLLAFAGGVVRYVNLRLRARTHITLYTAIYTTFIHGIHAGFMGIIVGLAWALRRDVIDPMVPMLASAAIGSTGLNIAEYLKSVAANILRSMLAGLAPGEKQEHDHDG